MVGMGGVNMSEALIRQTIARALNVVIQLSRGTDGKRRITAISEITDMQAGVITMQDIFKFEQTGTDAQGKLIGQFRFTGIRPRALDRIERYGIDPAEIIKPYL
jgi:pilus assembly protein CpaF